MCMEDVRIGRDTLYLTKTFNVADLFSNDNTLMLPYNPDRVSLGWVAFADQSLIIYPGSFVPQFLGLAILPLGFSYQSYDIIHHHNLVTDQWNIYNAGSTVGKIVVWENVLKRA